MFNSVGKLPAEIQAKVLGVVLYGYTGNSPNNGQIPGYPAAQTKVICDNTLGADGVCGTSQISINAAHLSYSSRYAEGVDFLKGVIPVSSRKRGVDFEA